MTRAQRNALAMLDAIADAYHAPGANPRDAYALAETLNAAARRGPDELERALAEHDRPNHTLQ